MTNTIGVIRRLLLALLAFGLVGTTVDLVLLEHYEDSWQLVPLFLLAVSLVAIVAYLATRSAGSVRLIQLMMVLLIVSGLIGFGLHYGGNLEIQMDMDPTLSRWELFKKVMHAKAPPALAPASMAQLGLLGLVYTYRHPALRKEKDVVISRQENA
jgi:hypothetical protein